jgi:subtilisin family serine protease
MDTEGGRMFVNHLSRGRRRVGFLLAVQVVLALVILAAARPAAGGPLEGGVAAPAQAPLDKVEGKVLDQLAAKGAATFFVVLGERADLGQAAKLATHTARTTFVYQRLREHAERSQARLRQLLEASRVDYKPFWIANTVRATAQKDVLEKIAALPEVERVVPDGQAEIPKPSPGDEQARVQAEWNLDRIRAPEVWSTFGDRGEGIVVANVDSGVQFDHPALVAQYRGNRGHGRIDHNYNWFDPSQVCGNPSLAPCDNVGHGTPTMGTMVGDDGGGNQIGVAPHARWIAAKGCETSSCSHSALLASGEWIIAPTDLSGQKPRPDLAPHIVNNSWGSVSGDPFYQDIVSAWNAAGIFSVFSAGDYGYFGCGTAVSPGDYVNSYGVGGFYLLGDIYGFSGRGASAFGGETKPNITAPIGVRSSIPGSSYDLVGGTSMAAPHVAGTVALIWAAAPSVLGQVEATRQLLDDTAIDTEDLQCGGTADDNNVWGEGRLDAFAAVEAAPRGPTGTLRGTVTDQATGAPIQGATVRTTGTADRTVITRADGGYDLVLPVGSYEVTAARFGFLTQTASGVVVSEGQTTTQDFALAPAPAHAVSGQVRDDSGNPLAGVTVTIEGTPIASATTDANGAYRFPSVPEGEYDVSARPIGCYDPQTRQLVVDGDEVLDVTLPQRRDHFGHFCRAAAFEWVDATTDLPLSGNDASTQVELPFPAIFYGEAYTTAQVSTNGFLNFLAPDASYFNGPIPSASLPNAAVYPFWDDLDVDGAARVQTEVLGSAPNRRFVIEWDNVAFRNDLSQRVDVEVVLAESGELTLQYQGIDDASLEKGGSATIGIENAAGDDALQFSFDQPQVSDRMAILFDLPPSGLVQGAVTDANDGQGVAGARVRVLQDGAVVRQTTTGADGRYRVLQLPLGAYTIEASATDYSTETVQAILAEDGEVLTRDIALRTARAEVSPAALEFVVPAGQTRTKTLTLSNTGSLALEWEIRKTPAQASVLVYADDPYHPAPSTYLDQALQRLGMGYTAHYYGDFAGFESDLRAGSWDLVLFGNDEFFDLPPTSTLDALNDYVAGGGKLAFATTRLLNVDPSPLFAALGFDWAHDDINPPDPVHFWQPGHPAFSIPEQVPELTELAVGRCGICGLAGNARPGFAALAGYTTPGPDPDQAAMLLGNDNRTVFKGFPDGPNDADRDFDGVRDGVELWTNLIVGLETGFSPSYVPWLAASPTSGTLAPGRSQAVNVTVDTTGLAPGVYSATLFIRSNSGREPSLQVPVTLTMPAYYQAVDAAGGAYTDRAGDLWSADRQYAAGGFGYTNPSATMASTKKAISGTEDDPLYQTQRVNPTEYRFDGLPNGAYQVELGFAELTPRAPGTRLFDVIAENTVLLQSHDVAAEVGSLAADQHTFTVQVTDGQLNLRFVERRGFALPIVNAIRVFHRPAG